MGTFEASLTMNRMRRLWASSSLPQQCNQVPCVWFPFCDQVLAWLTVSPAATSLILPKLTTPAVQTMLPIPVPVHHLGMYREPSTLDPVEYYNNLPQQIPGDSSNSNASSLAILVDPVIATGGTCAAAIQTLREWGAKRIIVLAVIGADEGVQRVAAEWPEGCEVWIAAVDKELTKDGMLKPGLGDVGDRLFLTIGK